MFSNPVSLVFGVQIKNPGPLYQRVGIMEGNNHNSALAPCLPSLRFETLKGLGTAGASWCLKPRRWQTFQSQDLFADPAISLKSRGTKNINFEGFFGVKTKNPVHFWRIGFRRVLLNFYRFSSLFFPFGKRRGKLDLKASR
jgi:hypothetical protein